MPIATRGRAFVARAADNLWFVAIPVIAAIAIVGSVVAVSSSSLKKSDFYQYARAQAVKVNKESRQRSIDNCNRANPSRAYFRIRAHEFTTGTNSSPSYTTRISDQVFPILNCEAVVDNHGEPIPLAPAVEDQYIKLFEHRRVARVTHGEIVGSEGFTDYFGRCVCDLP